jgi:hypothetical protein
MDSRPGVIHEEGCPLPTAPTRDIALGVVRDAEAMMAAFEYAAVEEAFDENRDLLHELRTTIAFFAGELAQLQRGLAGVCGHCGKQYQPVRSTSRFCSDACRQAAHRERHA